MRGFSFGLCLRRRRAWLWAARAGRCPSRGNGSLSDSRPSLQAFGHARSRQRAAWWGRAGPWPPRRFPAMRYVVASVLRLQPRVLPDAVHLVPVSPHALVRRSAPSWRPRALGEQRRCAGDALAPRRAGRRLRPAGPAKGPRRLPGRAISLKPARFLRLGLADLLWFRAAEPAVCNLM